MERHLNDVLAEARTIAECYAETAAEIEHDGPAKAVALLRNAGLLPIALRREYGGLGYGIEPALMWPLLQLLKIIGYGSLSIGRIYEGHVNALRLLQTFGDSCQIERFSNDACKGHMFGIWNTGFGDDVTFEPVGNRIRLHGAKVFASGATCVTRPFVNGTLPDGGWQMAIVPLDEMQVTPDPSWWKPIGMQGSVSYRIDFEGIEISRDCLIGDAGDYQREPWLTGGAIRFAAVQLGAAEALLDVTLDELRQRGRGDHPFQQQRIAKMAILVESGELWLEGAARQARCAEALPEQFMNYVGMARTAVEQICFEIMQLAQQCIGVRGMLQPHPLERLLRDLTIYLRQPNPDGALSNVGRFALNQNHKAHSLWTL